MMKRTAKIVLIFIGLLYVLAGCAYKPQAKGYICIEKTPFKLTYIDYEKEITPDVVHDLVGTAKWFPYKETKLNDKNEVIIGYDATVIHTSSHSNTMDVK